MALAPRRGLMRDSPKAEPPESGCLGTPRDRAALDGHFPGPPPQLGAFWSQPQGKPRLKMGDLFPSQVQAVASPEGNEGGCANYSAVRKPRSSERGQWANIGTVL